MRITKKKELVHFLHLAGIVSCLSQCCDGAMYGETCWSVSDCKYYRAACIHELSQQKQVYPTSSDRCGCASGYYVRNSECVSNFYDEVNDGQEIDVDGVILGCVLGSVFVVIIIVVIIILCRRRRRALSSRGTNNELPTVKRLQEAHVVNTNIKNKDDGNTGEYVETDGTGGAYEYVKPDDTGGEYLELGGTGGVYVEPGGMSEEYVLPDGTNGEYVEPDGTGGEYVKPYETSKVNTYDEIRNSQIPYYLELNANAQNSLYEKPDVPIRTLHERPAPSLYEKPDQHSIIKQ